MSGARFVTARLKPRVQVALVALSASALASSAACARPSAAELVGGRPWHVTVYYTAVESFHSDPSVPVQGCAAPGCSNGDQALGEYPHSFVTAVREEGTGRITSAAHAGKYLNWSHDVGFWLDGAPRDAHGRPLEPFHSAAADELPDGTRLRLVDCGRFESGEAVPVEVCRKLRAGNWQIRDRFTPGSGGRQHIDLYIGEEDGTDFTVSGELYVSLEHVRFTAEN